MPRFVTEVMYIQHPDGNITCKYCGHTWRFLKQTKKRRCAKCKRVIYPKDKYANQCHPFCKGLCWIKVHDWITARQVWRAVPGQEGLLWKLAEARPVTCHDLMIVTGKPKYIVYNFIQEMVAHSRLIKKYDPVQAPDLVHQFKSKEYFYNKDKKWRKPSSRSRRPSFYQYFPTHWAMVDFLERHPDAVDKVNGEVPLWKPIHIRKAKILVSYMPMLLPRTPEERASIRRKIEEGQARNERQVGKSPNPRTTF